MYDMHFGMEPPPDTTFITLTSYDQKCLCLPRTAALHSQYLATILADEPAEHKAKAIPMPQTYLIHQVLQFVVSYLKLCDSMNDLPGSGYSREDQGRKLSGSHLPSIYFYLGEDTNRTAWEFARRAFMRALTDVPDALLVQMMHAANFLDVRSMLDSIVLQLAIRIEKETDSELVRRIAKDGGSVLVDGLVGMSNDYIVVDEELALQFVRALTILVPLGFAEEMRVFHVLTIPEVARCHPLENEIARAIRILTTKFGDDKMLSRFVLLFDNPDWPVRRFGLRTFFSTDMAQWTSSWIETVVNRLQHGNLDRREEAFRALRKLGVPVVQNHELPKRIRNTLMGEAMRGRGGIGDNSRRLISNEVNDCFFRDDDGRMLLRDRERWWALVDIVIKYRVALEEEDWFTALGVQPDDPNNPFRLLLEHILPPYCQHMYAKDHCVEDLVALTSADDTVLKSVALLALGYSANPYDRRIKKILLFHAKTSEELAEAAARHEAAQAAKAAAAAAAAAAEAAAGVVGGQVAAGAGGGGGGSAAQAAVNGAKCEGAGGAAAQGGRAWEKTGAQGAAYGAVQQGAKIEKEAAKAKEGQSAAKAGGGTDGRGDVAMAEATDKKAGAQGGEAARAVDAKQGEQGKAGQQPAKAAGEEEKKEELDEFGVASGEVELLARAAAASALDALKQCLKRWCQTCKMHMDWCHCPRCDRCNQHQGSCECGDESDCSRCGMERDACECWERHEEDYDSAEDEYLSDFEV